MWITNRFPGLWLIPALLPVILMTVYPIGHALWTSLHSVMILFPGEPFVGLDNYARVVTSNYFLDTLQNSLVLTLFAAPSVVLLGTLIALFLQQKFLGSQVVRSIVLLPWVLPGAISAVLWVWVFHPSFGILNGILIDLGLIDSAVPWLTSPRTALMAVTIAHVWTQIPFAVVLMMAALATINFEIIEAAAIDCRNPLKRFAYVTFPEIKSMIVVLLVYNALVAFTSYDLVYAMTGGGPGTATTLLSFQIWRESFSMYDFGAGSAVAFIVVLISAILIAAITKALPSDLFASD
ncbi:MAG: sugar ABC transporter permease [Cucumibacter sp.]